MALEPPSTNCRVHADAAACAVVTDASARFDNPESVQILRCVQAAAMRISLSERLQSRGGQAC